MQGKAKGKNAKGGKGKGWEDDDDDDIALKPMASEVCAFLCLCPPHKLRLAIGSILLFLTL